MKIQDRDKELMRLCYEQQFLILEHVRDYFFAGNYTEAKRRMRELTAEELVKAVTTARGDRKVFQLTKKGRAIGRAESKAEISRPTRPFDSQLEHDALVTSVRLRMESLLVGVWIPELAIRKLEIQEVPDGLFLFPDGSKIAVEIENSLKGRSRFVRRMLAWRDTKVRLVLYVATREGISARLQDFMSEAPRSPRFGLVQWQELKHSKPTIWTPHGGVDLFKNGELK